MTLAAELTSAGVASYLAFIVTPVQAPFEIAVDHPV
jgi:hypothetical protein